VNSFDKIHFHSMPASVNLVTIKTFSMEKICAKSSMDVSREDIELLQVIAGSGQVSSPNVLHK